jgi:hypothetical protein
MAARSRISGPLIPSSTAARSSENRFDVNENIDLDELRSDRSVDTTLDNLLENYSLNLIPSHVKFKFRTK